MHETLVRREETLGVYTTDIMCKLIIWRVAVASCVTKHGCEFIGVLPKYVIGRMRSLVWGLHQFIKVTLAFSHLPFEQKAIQQVLGWSANS